MNQIEGSDGLITIIGRGNSGTRILSHTLYASGVYMGKWLNDSGDTLPARPMYEACRLFNRHVHWKGGLSWDFSHLHEVPIDPVFEEKVRLYLEDVLASSKPHRGWKLPETTLVYPWIVRMFPEIKYIHIVRDPRDCLLGGHLTDDLGKGNIEYPETNDKFEQRVASWKYQHEIVKATSTPKDFLSIRYEDLVLDTESVLEQLEGFLGIPLARIVIDETRVGRWKSDGRVLPYLQPLADDMRELGYD